MPGANALAYSGRAATTMKKIFYRYSSRQNWNNEQSGQFSNPFVNLKNFFHRQGWSGLGLLANKLEVLCLC
jgi:hypothetical protein